MLRYGLSLAQAARAAAAPPRKVVVQLSRFGGRPASEEYDKRAKQWRSVEATAHQGSGGGRPNSGCGSCSDQPRSQQRGAFRDRDGAASKAIRRVPGWKARPTPAAYVPGGHGGEATVPHVERASYAVAEARACIQAASTLAEVHAALALLRPSSAGPQRFDRDGRELAFRKSSGERWAESQALLRGYCAACARAGQLGSGRGALALLDELRLLDAESRAPPCGSPLQGLSIKPSVHVYGATIDAVARSADVPGHVALELLEAMRRDGLRPSPACLTSAAKALGRREKNRGGATSVDYAKAWRPALTLLQRGYPAARVEPDLWVCNAVLHVLGKARRWREALEVLDAMLGGGAAAEAKVAEAKVAEAKAASVPKAAGASGASGGAGLGARPEAAAAAKEGGGVTSLSSVEAALDALDLEGEGGAVANGDYDLDAFEEEEEDDDDDDDDDENDENDEVAEQEKAAGEAGRGVKGFEEELAVAVEEVNDEGEVAGGVAAARAHGDVRAGEEELAVLATKLRGGPYPRPDERSFSAVLTACHGAGQHALADAILGLMGRHGVPPTTVVVNVAMAAASEVGAWEHALELMDALRGRTGGSGPEHTDAPGQGGRAFPNAKPDAISYGIAVKACAQVSFFKVAGCMLFPVAGNPLTCIFCNYLLLPNRHRRCRNFLWFRGN